MTLWTKIQVHRRFILSLHPHEGHLSLCVYIVIVSYCIVCKGLCWCILSERQQHLCSAVDWLPWSCVCRRQQACKATTLMLNLQRKVFVSVLFFSPPFPSTTSLLIPQGCIYFNPTSFCNRCSSFPTSVAQVALRRMPWLFLLSSLASWPSSVSPELFCWRYECADIYIYVIYWSVSL